MRAWREVRRFRRAPTDGKGLAFYAETASEWSYLGPVIELLGGMGTRVTYFTSTAHDPLIREPPQHVDSYYIGTGSARTYLFQTLRTAVLVLTMPDLNTFWLKRSRIAPVHYVYAFHSIVSTHMAYRSRAFDSYDTILAVGEHHVREIRATEKAYSLPPKTILRTGYPRLDNILSRSRAVDTERPPDSDTPWRVLVAPSWGPEGLLETIGKQVVEALLTAGHDVTVRPHPMTRIKTPAAIRVLQVAFDRHPSFRIESDVGSVDSFFAADVMVSDWSGAALEFAFGRERPVLYIDGPRKTNNPDHGRISLTPLEIDVRREIGIVVPPAELASIGLRVAELAESREQFVERIRRARERAVFNVETSAAVAARQVDAIYAAARGR